MEVKRERQSVPQDELAHRVSILVLMEVKREKQVFFPLFSPPEVSILVLMEVKRESPRSHKYYYIFRRFNPCFDGSEARGWSDPEYFVGIQVSILVLMEVKRERLVAAIDIPKGGVSILVLMEVKREPLPMPDRGELALFQSLF